MIFIWGAMTGTTRPRRAGVSKNRGSAGADQAVLASASVVGSVWAGASSDAVSGSGWASASGWACFPAGPLLPRPSDDGANVRRRPLPDEAVSSLPLFLIALTENQWLNIAVGGVRFGGISTGGLFIFGRLIGRHDAEIVLGMLEIVFSIDRVACGQGVARQ